ncbi:uracil-DNA glycosylase [Candidatus Saccharibacteria bacterium]|nr:uracil-DNA glycosylase [Candidatus Saccharibacteria bacterium]MBQ6147775.1 uracil-DNA glycosylase [Candidatus Saccharibacteria bacterium]MBQ6605597.1 uracil-DNA glycosylase [Candidatus Saccharibacteria bacterium]
MHDSWKVFLKSEFNKPYFRELSEFLKQEYKTKTIFPPKELVFNAFTTDLEKVKVVILGQDPYHTPGAAHGLAFSVPSTEKIPPSLINIYQEIESDLGTHKLRTGNLNAWKKQGVLLLNNVLTVEAHKAGSHRGHGWEIFTEATIKYLNDKKSNLVFILWGRDARSKKPLIDQQKHLILESAHPSPLSAYNGFFGSKPFSKTNAYLREHGLEEIDW